MPIVISLDYHANVTPAMAAQVDAVSGYLTYPHVDRPETGIRAAAAMQHVLEARPHAGARLAQDAVSHSVAQPVHDGRAVARHRRADAIARR